MTRFTCGLMCSLAAAVAASAHAASGDKAPQPGTGATEVVTQATPPPAQPPVTPAGGFPAIVVPMAIAIGIAVGVSVDENDSVTIPGTGTGTGTGSQ